MTSNGLLLLVLIALGACDANNGLALSVPSYSSTGGSGFFGIIIYTLVYALIGLFGILPLSELSVYQVIVLATLACSLFVRHIIFDCIIPIGLLPSGEYVIFIILSLMSMAIAFLSLNIKFRHLFGSIGAGYISAYEIILIFGVSSYSISIILVVAAISGILTISKFNDFLLNCFVRATLVPFCFLLAVNSILMNVFVKLHFKDSYRMVTFPIAVCLGLGILLCFAMVFFQREIKEKVEELRSNADEKVEKVDDEDKAKEAI